MLRCEVNGKVNSKNFFSECVVNNTEDVSSLYIGCTDLDVTVAEQVPVIMKATVLYSTFI